MPAVRDKIEPTTIHFADDGLVPNNPMPFLVYKGAVALDSREPEATIEKLFGSNGWGAMWRNGVYDFLHYHATVHEVLGIARGSARVRFGGDKGKVLEIAAGDVVILPAGTGHQCLGERRFFRGRRIPARAADGFATALAGGARQALKTIPMVRCRTPIR